jgi:hypothetical protein
MRNKTRCLFFPAVLFCGAITVANGAPAKDAPVLQQSHAWIVVTQDAPERTGLEKAGFIIDPEVSHHDGQGTSSISVEFTNGYVELLYPDTTVSVSPELQAGAEKFRLKSRWRETG